MGRTLLITFILIITILWTTSLAKRCPRHSHCTCDYEGFSYCGLANSNVTLTLSGLGSLQSSLYIDCSECRSFDNATKAHHLREMYKHVFFGFVPEWSREYCTAASVNIHRTKDINFSCSDLPELGAFEVYQISLYRCSPRVLRCLGHILGDVQMSYVSIDKPTEALQRDDVTDLKDVKTLWLTQTDDIIMNSDAIYGWPSLSQVYVRGGKLQLSPNNTISNKSLKDITLTSTKTCSLPEGGFSGLKNLNSLKIYYDAKKPCTTDGQDTSEVHHMNIHARAFKGLTELEEISLTGVKSIEARTFIDTPKLTNVDISGSQLTSLPNGVLNGMTSLYKISLDCEGKEIAFGTHTFSENIELEAVDLRNCKLNSLSDYLFNNSNNIKYIEIKDGGIKNVSSKIFSNLSTLEHLTLTGNNIEELPYEIFANLTSLQELELPNSGIMKLQDHIFSNLLSLTELLLNDNNIQELSEIIFSCLTSLESLQLQGNKIQKLPGGIFTKLSSLSKLNLNDNNIEELPEGIFASLTALTSLSLENNNLTKLCEDSFTNLTSLLDLDLSNNNLEKLPNKLFTTLSALETLLLHTNNIRELPDFTNLTSLKELDLSNNFLVHLSPYSFYKLNNLETLTLSNNTINKLEAYVFNYMMPKPPDVPTSPFHPLKKLDTLDLSGNHLRQLYIYWQNDLRHVSRLDLSNNRFTNIKDFQIDFSNMSIEIDLQNNEITEALLDPRASYSNDSSWDTSSVILSNNPIVCDCNIYGLLRRIQGYRLSHEPLYHRSDYSESSDIVCAAPSNLEGYLLEDVLPEQLVYDLSEHLPENCNNYTAVAVTNEVILSCPKMPSTWIDFDANDFLYQFFEEPTTTLNLDNQPQSIEHLNIHTLNLSNTNIDKISFVPTDSLKVLDVTHNSLAAIPVVFLNSNISLYLADNPILCDCELVRKFNNMTNLYDAASITCINEGKLKDINVKELCDRLNSLTAVIGISAVCGVLFIMITVPLVKYIRKNWRNILRNCSCSRRHKFQPVDLSKVTANKPFDLFISFTYEDEEFVRENLLPKLEFEYGQKLCLHYRDWLDEDLDPDQITESVDNSTKTVIVLTESYLKSQLTYVAFSRAHFLSKQHGISRIIVILLDKDVIENEIISDDLKSYLTSNTCLLWGDYNFWTQFKDILPKNN